VVAVAFSPDGKRLASVAHTGGVHLKLWDLTTRGEGRPVEQPDGFVSGLAFSPDGTRLAASVNRKGAFLYDLTTGERRQLSEGMPGWNTTVAFSPDGKWVALGWGDGTVRCYPAEGGQPLALHRHVETDFLRAHQDVEVMCVAFGPAPKDGGTALLASGASDRAVKVWSLDDARPGLPVVERRRLAGGGFLPDGRLVLGEHDEAAPRVGVWDVSGPPRRLRELAGPFRSLSVVACGGGRVAVADRGGDDAALTLWDGATGAALGRLGTPGRPVDRLDFSADGALLAAARGRQVLVWDVALRREAAAFDADHPATSLAFADGGRLLVAGRYADGAVLAWGLDTGREVWRLRQPHRSPVHDVAASPDGLTVASAATASSACGRRGRARPGASCAATRAPSRRWPSPRTVGGWPARAGAG
jgi:hypothetical protein